MKKELLKKEKDIRHIWSRWVADGNSIIKYNTVIDSKNLHIEGLEQHDHALSMRVLINTGVSLMEEGDGLSFGFLTYKEMGQRHTIMTPVIHKDGEENRLFVYNLSAPDRMVKSYSNVLIESYEILYQLGVGENTKKKAG